MTSAQLLARVKKNAAPDVTLLLGPEAYERRRIKEALAAQYPADAVAQHDLAEAAMPKGKAAVAAEEDDGEGGGSGDSSLLSQYVSDPTPGVVMVFEAIRFDFEGDDKRRQDRVRKFYAAIPDVVELRRYAPQEARREAESLIRTAGFHIHPDALDLLIEALGADIARIAVEIDKLALFAGGREVTTDDISALVPDARASNVFALVNAMGRRDRARSLEILDTLTREGEYLPLALSFLSTQFRTALVAKEAGLKSAGQIQQHFTRLGIAMWQSRADQVYQTVSRFTGPQLERAIELIFEADRGLRDARPDDRIVLERFILELAG